ncbi:MAG: hypothetical protein NC388_07355 [Clostridium sp.]|nr:hypothetical protein [Clostridium sp.]
MKTISFRVLISAAIVTLLPLQKTVAQKAIVLPVDNAKITLQSYPDGARVYHNGKLICASTPATVEIPYQGLIVPGSKKLAEQRMKRSAEANTIELTFVKDGYITAMETIKPTITQSGKNNYLFDWPKSVLCELRESPNNGKDRSVPKGEAKKQVSRERAGETSLERTIIRWYFESAPQGARVFWRVVSSVPDEVKNTNETYLGTTPYEDTRSFNIVGLSYDNSRDVQIEIKVKRKGYIDQTKRFNVRQAIDQQEISSFFDLIKEETETE